MMEQVQLGRTGMRVSRLCLGALNFGGTADEAESVAMVHAALDAGITFLNTADIYNDGLSERIVGTALRGRRDDVVLSTMGGLSVGAGPNDYGNSRRHLISACEQSLRRLSTDWIDLYQLHRPDPATPIEETLQALADLVQAGKVRYIGTSEFPAWQVMEALATATRSAPRGAPATEQPQYHLLDRSAERELLPLAKRYGLGILPWSPLAAGVLTGKYRGGNLPEGSRFTMADTRARTADPAFAVAVCTAEQLGRLAEEAGLTLPQLSLGWLLDQPGVTAPVIGPRTRDQLAAYLEAADVSLDDGLRTAVDGICPPGEAVYHL
jgi:aryl-alcohol dehydrogenase-like predicted oxidoreductase